MFLQVEIYPGSEIFVAAREFANIVYLNETDAGKFLTALAQLVLGDDLLGKTAKGGGSKPGIPQNIFEYMRRKFIVSLRKTRHLLKSI